MTVLAWDLGGVPAWCVGHPDSEPELGHIKPQKTLGLLLMEFEATLRGLIEREGVTVLAWERPFISFSKQYAGATVNAQRQFGQAGALERYATLHNLPNASYVAKTIRAGIIGDKNAKKPEIMAFARGEGMTVVNDHEADAYVVWRAAVEQFHPHERRAA